MKEGRRDKYGSLGKMASKSKILVPLSLTTHLSPFTSDLNASAMLKVESVSVSFGYELSCSGCKIDMVKFTGGQ